MDDEQDSSSRKKKEPKQSIPFLAYVKAIFLLLIIGLGVVGVSFMSQKQLENTVEAPSKTLESVLGVRDQILGIDQVKKVSDDLGQKGVSKTIEGIGEDIKGTATQAAETAMKEATDSTVDFIYDMTIVQVIETMIKSLPERTRGEYMEQLCKP